MHLQITQLRCRILAAGGANGRRTLSTRRATGFVPVVARAAVMASTLDWQMIGPRRTEVDGLFRGSPWQLDRHIAISSPQSSSAGTCSSGHSAMRSFSLHTRLIGIAAAEIRPICDRSHRFRLPVNLLSGAPWM